jgi:hypothetical protein
MKVKPTVGAFHRDISFHAQHAPVGAFFSFTVGKFCSTGGMGLEIGKPAEHDVYVGVMKGDGSGAGEILALPLFKGGVVSDVEAGGGGEVDAFGLKKAKRAGLTTYGREEIVRRYGLGTDVWETPDFTYTIYTPYFSLPDVERGEDGDGALAVLPAVVSGIEIDNTAGTEDKTLFFAIDFRDPAVLPVGAGSQRPGFVYRQKMGGMFACDNPRVKVELFQRWKVEQGLVPLPTEACGVNSLHQLGTMPGAKICVPAGQKATLRVALGVYRGEAATAGREMKYFYTRYYKNLTEVLGSALDGWDKLTARARQLDAELAGSGLSNDQQFLCAHATRSYHGSTMLLDDGGRPFWAVNEGEYCMINTLDLSVDQLFWEMKHNPWVVRNILDSFVRYYSYKDTLKARTGDMKAGGLSFCHDMGAFNNFSPDGNSSYELPELNAMCFSFMTAEQLCNWVLMAATYVKQTGDVAWAQANDAVISACLQSLVNRAPGGVIEFDSSRCGKTGAEITTYDSLDHSLAQTRNNLYMAVKAWASYLGLDLLMGVLGKDEQAATAKELAGKAEAAVVAQAGTDGVIPAVFEKENSGYTSRILPAVEGLVYPCVWGMNVSTEWPRLTGALSKHAAALLRDVEQRNYFGDGGIRLSSTSANSWMSKIAIVQHVCRKVLKFEGQGWFDEAMTRADAAHATWMTTGDSAYWACSDQFINCVAKASRYYPRIVTTVLWRGS